MPDKLLPENIRRVGAQVVVPPSILRSRAVTWLWLHTSPTSWLHYDRARWLARRLP